MTCIHCGRRCQGRACRECEREVRRDRNRDHSNHRDRDGSDEPAIVVHAVCHDCPDFEAVTADGSAWAAASDHRDATGHDISTAVLDGPGAVGHEDDMLRADGGPLATLDGSVVAATESGTRYRIVVQEGGDLSLVADADQRTLSPRELYQSLQAGAYYDPGAEIDMHALKAFVTEDDEGDDVEDVLADGGTTVGEIRPGDVVVDLAQGRPMLVVEQAAETVQEWEREHDYELLENYGNSRLGATVANTVWTCVYVSNIRSEPSKSYDFPEARVARIEHEAATGERVQEVLAERLLTRLLIASGDGVEPMLPSHAQLERVATEAGVSERVIEAARAAQELAAAEGGDSE